MRLWILVLACSLALSLSSEAGSRRSSCRSRSKCVQQTSVKSCCGAVSYSSSERTKTVTKTSVSNVSSLQAWADTEARLMSERGTNGHVQGVPGPGYFVGVGCNGATCSRPGPPVVEARYRDKTVRVWKIN